MPPRTRHCHVCGKLGHLAAECANTERVCFNCGQPGHENSACPQPQSSSARQCYRCGESGHIKADCPNAPLHVPSTPAAEKPKKEAPAGEREPKKACSKCGGSHLARTCQAPSLASRSNEVVSARVTSRVKCHNCSERGHFARDCPRDKRCYRCQGSGHVAGDCPNPTDA